MNVTQSHMAGESTEITRTQTFLARTSSAIRRRARWAWKRVHNVDQTGSAEAAIEWLRRHSHTGGLRPTPQSSDICPGLTGAALATAAVYGQRDLVAQWSAWLSERQRPDGSLPDALGEQASAANTAHALDGWLAASELLPEYGDTARRAAEYLIAQLRVGSPGWLAIECIGPLFRAARAWQTAEWEQDLSRAMTILRGRQPHGCAGVNHALAAAAEAMVDYGDHEAASVAMRMPAALQRRDGSVPATLGGRWISSRGLAHLAVVWYKLGEHERADRALECLVRHQSTWGGFPGSWGRGAAYYPQQEAAWTVKYFLDASWLQVARAFAAKPAALPHHIAADDGRVRAVIDWCAALETDAKVIDVGCGRGRFFEHVAKAQAGLRLTGVDRLAQPAAAPPNGWEFRQGSMLWLPAADAEFDAAMAIESLEHALAPRTAIDELCRAVRAGGRVLVIDKDRSRQALSEHQPWERWFAADEVSAWLARHCDDVSVRPIAHGSHRKPTGLFLCWTGVRRDAAISKPASATRRAA